MTTGMLKFRKGLLLLGMGGSTLAFSFFGGATSCASNAALTNFYTGVGHASIDTAADAASNIGGDFGDIIVTPTTAFLKDLWTVYVDTRIPTDPIFDRLLVE